MRAWYQKDMALGLLYSCTLGHVRPDCPLALIQNRRADGTDFMEVVPCEHQMPGQREQARAPLPPAAPPSLARHLLEYTPRRWTPHTAFQPPATAWPNSCSEVAPP